MRLVASLTNLEVLVMFQVGSLLVGQVWGHLGPIRKFQDSQRAHFKGVYLI